MIEQLLKKAFEAAQENGLGIDETFAAQAAFIEEKYVLLDRSYYDETVL